MSAQFDSTTRNGWASSLNTALGANAVLKIFTGTAPSTVAGADSGTLLATLSCNATAFGAAAGGVLTANSISSATAAASGTAGYFRIYDSGAACHAQGTVGTSGADLNFSSVGWSSGDTITISSLTLTMPGA